LIAQRTLSEYAKTHPQARASLESRGTAVNEAAWTTMNDV